MGNMLLGIDLGTSSVRAGLFDTDGTCLGIGSGTYPILVPVPGAAEQEPQTWWNATVEAIREALISANRPGSDIGGISFSGQMHGAAFLDRDGEPVCPAIIWADTRSTSVLPELKELIGDNGIERILMNLPFAGTQASISLWLNRHNHDIWKRVRRILSPKDYIRWRICGLYNTEPTDASATLLADVGLREWSNDILGALGIPVEFLPFMVNSDQVIGETEGIEPLTGIPDGIPVVLGGADQASAALGNGILDPGTVLVTIGTGGQVFAPLTTATTASGMGLNIFCHLPGSRWYYLGASLAGGLALSWYRRTFTPDESFDTLSAEAASVAPGAEGLSFLPFLNGRRTPRNSEAQRGSFTGIGYGHSHGHFVRAVMEGVVFELRELFDDMIAAGVSSDRLIASGGFTNSPVWLSILADCFEQPVMVSRSTEQAVLGAALTAGVGIGQFGSFTDACTSVSPPADTIEPDTVRSLRYGELYAAYLETVTKPVDTSLNS